MKKFWGNIHSIKFNLSLISILFSVPVVLFLLCTNIYSVETAREKEADLIRNNLRVYQSQTDSAFENIEKYLVGLLAQRRDLLLIAQKTSDNDTVLAKMRLKNQFMDIMAVNEPLYGMFAFSQDNGNIAYYYTPGIKKTEREALNEMLLNMDAASIPSGWFPQWGGGQCYFLRMVRLEHVWLGAAVKSDDLIQSFKTTGEDSVNDYLYIDTGGNILTRTILSADAMDMAFLEEDYGTCRVDGHKYMVTGTPSAAGAFILAAIAREKGIFADFSMFQFLVIGIVCLCVIIMKIQRSFFQKKIIFPVSTTVKAMENVRAGDLDAHIDKQKAFDEFQLVHETFNTMVADIRQLKIDVYEERLRHKQTTLQYLQLQLNPHFFVNAINMVQRLMETGDYPKASEMMVSLTEYMRYVLSCSKSVVSLHSELSHVDNYVQIQNIRHKTELIVNKSVDPYTLFCAVPQMLIHTFVENAFKYAAPSARLIYVYIQSRLDSGPAGDYLTIEITDSGPGYPENILNMLRQGAAVLDERGEHIGLHNLQSRLELIYGGRAEFSAGNKDGHAWAMIKLPAVEIEAWEMEKNV